MDTRDVGDEQDLDSLSEADLRRFDEADKLYQTFHQKQPLRVADLGVDLPEKSTLLCVGDALAVMYRTDKWKADGNDEDYKHLHDAGEERPYAPMKGVKLYVPSRLAPAHMKSRVKKNFAIAGHFPTAYPESLTLLGKCLGFFLRSYDDGEIYEIDRLKHSYLFASPNGKMLCVFAARPEPTQDGAKGFLCLMTGGKLRVIKDGIDG